MSGNGTEAEDRGDDAIRRNDPPADDAGRRADDARRRPAKPNLGRTTLALLAVCVPLTLLVAPRPTLPRILPLPEIDRETRRESEERERRLAREAGATLLAHEVRLVGELYRRVGRALSERAPAEVPLRQLRAAAASLLEAKRTDELLLLRALQTELFVHAVEEFGSGSGQPSLELEELGGDFARVAKTSWFSRGKSLLSDDDLRTLFRVRWGTLVGTHRMSPFGPSLEDFRAYYAIYLRHPEHALGTDPAEVARSRIRYARALGALDSTYPTDFAVGVFALTAQDEDTARTHLARYISQGTDRPYGLAARNHLVSLGPSDR